MIKKLVLVLVLVMLLTSIVTSAIRGAVPQLTEKEQLRNSIEGEIGSYLQASNLRSDNFSIEVFRDFLKADP